MNHCRFARFIAAGLTVTALGTVLSAFPLPAAGSSVEILVGGAPQPRYPHGGRWYVEARKAREYAIQLHNPYDVRVAVALSVDGLNTIDARETTAAEARKWVIGPHETITITGWQTSQREARRFEFTTEAGSYGQALGKTANLGLISAVFFKERVPEPVLTPERSNESRSRRLQAPPPGAQAEPEAGAALKADKDEFAATGMGRRTDHPVTQIWLDLEDAPAQTVNIRYEFRPTLVRLGILPSAPPADPLQRREHAQGFQPGYCPDPQRSR